MSRPDPSAAIRHAMALDQRLAPLWPDEILHQILVEGMAGRVAVVSSFGAESAVLLHMVAQVAPATPVLFLDTLRHFPETLRYRDDLVERLGLTDVRNLEPDASGLAAQDAELTLAARDPDACCALRKTAPLQAALAAFDGWVSGRKRFQAATRATLQVVEADGPRLKFNPLATWDAGTLAAYAQVHELPAHPLVARGFPSIGCAPCTQPVADADDPRSGRWAGRAKIECGIHVAQAGGLGQ
jgi:phosphoadenosine phosphosulfate reductase